MLDEESFIKSRATHLYNIYSKEELIQEDNKLNYDIYNTQIKTAIFKKISKFNLGGAITLIVIGIIFAGNIVTMTGLSILTGIVIVKSIGYIGYNYFEKKIEGKKADKKALEKAIEQYENDNEEYQEQLKDDKRPKKIRKNILEKIEDLDKDELLAIRTIIDEYANNKDIPSQVGNIAQFLTETQVGDVDIEDTSLYNKHLDEEAKGKVRSYSIEYK